MRRVLVVLAVSVALVCLIASGASARKPNILVIDIVTGVQYGIDPAFGTLDGVVEQVFEQMETKDQFDWTVVSTIGELETEFARIDDYDVAIFAYHVIQDSQDLMFFLMENVDALYEWVHRGGAVISTTRDDPDNVLIDREPFNLWYTGLTFSHHAFEITDPDHPVFTTPNVIDDVKYGEEVLANCVDTTAVNDGIDAFGSSLVSIADILGIPTMFVGDYGDGKVLFTALEFFWFEHLAVEENTRLVENILHWAVSD